MSYNKIFLLGNRLSTLPRTRRLHDSKLPSVTNFLGQSNLTAKLIGVESPRKADISYPILVNTESRIEFPARVFTNKTEYDDKYTSKTNYCFGQNSIVEILFSSFRFFRNPGKK